MAGLYLALFGMFTIFFGLLDLSVAAYGFGLISFPIVILGLMLASWSLINHFILDQRWIKTLAYAHITFGLLIIPLSAFAAIPIYMGLIVQFHFWIGKIGSP